MGIEHQPGQSELVEKIIKKDNSYSIQMKFYNVTIPLSRSKVKEFKSFIGL